MDPRERRPFGGSMSRRAFLRQSAGTAFAVSGAGAILAACGKASNPSLGGAGATTPSGSASATAGGIPLARADHPVTWPIYDDNQPIADGLSPESNATLKIYN